jgi:hypothetical protein
VDIELPIAFAVEKPEAPLFQIRVNFGMTAGREATPAEIDELAKALMAEVEQVTIVAERRHAFADGSEALLHQVTVAVDSAVDDPDRLVEIAERWARACFRDRHAEITEP